MRTTETTTDTSIYRNNAVRVDTVIGERQSVEYLEMTVGSLRQRDRFLPGHGFVVRAEVGGLVGFAYARSDTADVDPDHVGRVAVDTLRERLQGRLVSSQYVDSPAMAAYMVGGEAEVSATYWLQPSVGSAGLTRTRQALDDWLEDAPLRDIRTRNRDQVPMQRVA